jgi:hypothetical protein
MRERMRKDKGRKSEQKERKNWEKERRGEGERETRTE